jgi:hypothetical protein
MTFAPEGRTQDYNEFTKCLDYFQSQGYNEIDTGMVQTLASSRYAEIKDSRYG